MAINDGGFWYPKGQGEHFADRGVTVRDVFAARALAAVLHEWLGDLFENDKRRAIAIAKVAPAVWEIADAMIAQRARDYRAAGQDDGTSVADTPWRLDLDPD